MASLTSRFRNFFKKKNANKNQPVAQAPHQQNGVSKQEPNGVRGEQPYFQAGPQGNAHQQPLRAQQHTTAAAVATSATTSGNLTVKLQNQTTSSTVYAYISGFMMLQASSISDL